jgi:hypothetical protein
MIRHLKNLAREVLNTSPGRLAWNSRVRRKGTFREKELVGLVDRSNYAYGMLRAADLARFLGIDKATVCEFGVATGKGLRNLVDLAGQIQAETGVEIRVVGFDSGAGLPTVDGYADHPEIWSVGDFAMNNKDELRRRVEGRAELIFGDIADTVADFVAGLDGSAPLGFVSIDVDVYSGAKSALRCLLGAPELYTPAISVYCDDVQFYFANRWCGELRAIEEFNNENAMRKIDQDRSLPGMRPDRCESWYRSMFVCHVLDHEVRTRPVSRSGLSLNEHFAMMKELSLL